MSDTVEYHSHMSVTSHSSTGAMHAEVHLTHVHTPQEESSIVSLGANEAADVADHFDIEISCDAKERALIASLRRYLRPPSAPQCLFTRLSATLDQCCLYDADDEQ
ncbi:hypothetical protein CRD60_01275 [Bifidobacterium aemilianum]|uniref:Uncharacterized protein n=1 Tax=Bifidobacterium aemilianum TaxID=2493120 RepID=A0A366KBA1_9BIFI|nr:hypothetical protein [Bifidobacterium aemilianum]RBP98522.1 hypothetical protein CRD60_01275 [Bifidobacterium aemilianum]